MRLLFLLEVPIRLLKRLIQVVLNFRVQLGGTTLKKLKNTAHKRTTVQDLEESLEYRVTVKTKVQWAGIISINWRNTRVKKIT